MEQGENPEQVEREMGDLLEGDDAFSLDGLQKKMLSRQRQPLRDEKLYPLISD